MKKIYLIILLIVICSSLIGQGSITLLFTGEDQATGVALDLDSVVINNLTQQSKVSVTGDNLSYTIDPTTNIEGAYSEPMGEFKFTKVYPNPFENTVNLELSVPFRQKVVIYAYTISGQLSAVLHGVYAPGTHLYQFQANSSGIFIFHAKGENGIATIKAVSNNSTGMGSALSYAGMSSIEYQLKVASVANENWTFDYGDNLQLIAYSKGRRASVILSPNATQTVNFAFGNNYYAFSRYNVQTSAPCFVNTVYSVIDENGKGVDYLGNPDFFVREDGNPISKSESFAYVRKQSTIPFGLKTVLLIDNSISLSTSDIDYIKTAAKSFVSRLIPEQEMAIYVFSDQSTMLVDFTKDKNELIAAINNITLGFPSTNLYGSIITCLNKWNNRYTTSYIEEGNLIVFTDGTDTQGSYTERQVLVVKGNKTVFTIGLGNELNEDALNNIAAPRSVHKLNTISQLENTFDEIQNDIIKYANSFYLLKYMSPKRSGKHTLQLYINDNNNTGADAVLESEFSAYHFKSVTYGVYANVTYDELYGTDSITFDKIKDPVNGFDPYQLEAVTFWAYDPPEYQWQIDDPSVATILVDAIDKSKATITPQKVLDGSTYITLKDIANNYQHQIDVVTKLPVVCNSVVNTKRGKAFFGGQVNASLVETCGVIWGLNPDVTWDNRYSYKNLTRDVNNVIEEEINIPNINQTYYVRAFVTEGDITHYSNEISIISKDLPVVETTVPTLIKATSIKIGGNITEGGANGITERGIYYKEDISGNNWIKVADNSVGDGEYTIEIYNLKRATNYLYKAYAINDAGEVCGEEKIVLTDDGQITIWNSVLNIEMYQATMRGRIQNSGGDEILNHGFIWNTDTNVDFTNNIGVKTSQGGNLELFEFLLTNLNPDKDYFFRTFATNCNGTFMSEVISFTTKGKIRVATINPNYIKTINGFKLQVEGGIVNFDCSSYNDIIEFGFIYDKSENANYTNVNSYILGNSLSNDLFKGELSALPLNSEYYIKAYVKTNYNIYYGQEKLFKTLYGTIKDIDGNIYYTAEIDNQIWMAENLKTTKYNDGTQIANVEDGIVWGGLTTPAFCWYDNEINYKDVYGALYNWYTVESDKLCPTGWHIPTENEWDQLIDYAGGFNYAGRKLKERGDLHWTNQSIGYHEVLCFTALPGGMRHDSGLFWSINTDAYWWSSSFNGQMATNYRISNSRQVMKLFNYKEEGYSVRCIKD